MPDLDKDLICAKLRSLFADDADIRVRDSVVPDAVDLWLVAQDAQDVLWAMVSEVDDVLAGGELIDRRRRLHLTAEAWRAGRLSDADARSQLAHLSPRSCEWIGTFEQLRRDDDEFVRDVRTWYWDEDPKDAPIPDRLLDDFIETFQEYGDARAKRPNASRFNACASRELPTSFYVAGVAGCAPARRRQRPPKRTRTYRMNR